MSTSCCPPLPASTSLPAPPSFPTSGNTHLFSVSIVRSFQQRYINGVTQSVHSLDRLLSSSRIFWRLIKVIKSINTNCSFPSFFIAEYYSLLPRDHILSSHSSLETHLVVSGLGPLQTKLLWTFMCRFFCEYICLHFTGRKKKKPRILQLLGCIVVVYLVCQETGKPFSKQAVPLLPTSKPCERSSFSASLSAHFCSVTALICRLLAPPLPSLGSMRQEETPGPSHPQGSFIS